MTLDNDDSDDAGAGDEAKGASGDIDIGCIKQGASLHKIFVTSDLALMPTETIDVSGLWYGVEEPTCNT